MPTTTNAQIAAELTSGPRTEHQQEVARTNAMKHGLNGAGLALSIEDPRQIEAFFADLHAEICPQTLLGSILVKQVAISSIRLDRSARQEVAHLQHQLRHAETNHDEARKGDADHALGWIKAEPATYRRQLLATPEGVDCLIKALSSLHEDMILEAHLWDVNHEMKLEAYFGRRSDDLPYSRGRRLSWAIQNDLSMLTPEEAEQAKAKGTQAWAVEEMSRYIIDEIKYLTECRTTFDHAKLARDRAEAIERAAVDNGKDSLLAKKFDAATKRDLYRALKELRIVEKTGKAPRVEPRTPPIEAEATPPRTDIKPPTTNDLDLKLGSFEQSSLADPSALDEWIGGADLDHPAPSRPAESKSRPRLE